MTNAERRSAVLASIHRHTVASTVSQSAAQKVLVDEGIYTTNFQLTVEYGGQPEKQKADA